MRRKEISPGTSAPVRERSREESPVRWTKAARQQLLPRRGGLFLPQKNTDAKSGFQSHASSVSENILAMLERGIKKASPEIAPLQRAVFEGLTDPAGMRLPLPLTEESLAVLLAILGRNESTILFASQQAGFATALDACIRSWSLDGKSDKDFKKEFWIERRPLKLGLGDRPDEALRKAAVEASEDEFSRALKLAREARKGASLELKCLFSYVFPEEPAWAAEDAQECLASQTYPTFGWKLLASLDDFDLAAQIVDRSFQKGQWGMDESMYVWGYDRVLLESFGSRALEFLRRFINPKLSAAQKRDMAEVIGLVETEEAASIMASFARDKAARKHVIAYFDRLPHFAFSHLAPVTRSIKKEDEVTGLIRRLAQENPVALTAALPRVEEPVRRYLETLSASVQEKAAQTASLQLADNEMLPECLATPPWERKLPDVVIPEIELTIPAEPARALFKPEDTDVMPYYYTKAPQTAKNDEKYLKRIEENLEENGTVQIWGLESLSDAAALAEWNSRPAGIWSLADYGFLPLLKRFGLRALPGLLQMAKREPFRTLDTLSRIVTPAVAPLMADSFVRLKKGRVMAEGWFLAHPDVAALGLIPPALGPASPSRDACRTGLRFLNQNGQAASLRAAAGQFGPEVSAALDLLLETRAPEKAPEPLPPFAVVNKLPEVKLPSGKVLPPGAVRTLLGFLQASTPSSPHPDLGAVRAACDKASLEKFAWALFQSWLSAGAPAKEDWTFVALGLLGGDETARELTPMIRAWPGEAAHARAVLGLDVLGLIGTDLALMLLNGMAEKLKFKALQDKAKEKVERIARIRGLTAEELSDRLVPDLGLDPDGSRLLDFGPRQFRVGFDEVLMPYVRDTAGHRLSDLPKPVKSDVPARAAEAVETWKALKKDAKALASIQIARLERFLSTRRRMAAPGFRMFLVEHPLVFHLTRRLVLGTYGQDGTLIATFRVAEDRSFSTSMDEPFELDSNTSVGIPHPLEMSPELLKSWSKLFSDYEILQPFPQLGRPVFRPSPRQGAKREFAFSAREVQPGSVLGLETRGWRRGYGESGCLLELVKPLPGGGEARLSLSPGIPLMAGAEREPQEIDKVELPPGVTLGDLEAVVYSELVYDIESLARA